ncbi:Clp protease N-terminal domain-containing protein, partial [Treponema lecithinolyticum]
MIKGLSPRLQKILGIYAQEEGRKSGADQLLPEHLLLAMVKSASSVGFALLQ